MIYASNNLIICIEKNKRKKNIYIYKEVRKRKEKKRVIKQKGDKMPQSK